MQIITHHLTSQGGRPDNQDAIKEVRNEDFILLALADGLGGQGEGAPAARLCVEIAAETFARDPGLSDGNLQAMMDAADRAVAERRVAQEKPAGSMRSTLALLAVCNDAARWAHVGDSRVYWFRDNMLMHRTRDHSVAELVAGLDDSSLAAPPDDADRNRLLRVVGTGGGCQADLSEITVTPQAGDAFLLCSDGVWSLVTDPEIAESLSGAANPVDWCSALEQRVKQQLACCSQGQIDDYSMILGMVIR
jgi:serine/threonine protein phosphatase PrpC